MHSMINHKAIEEVLENSISFEDMDSWLVIGKTENGSLCGDQYWKMDFNARAITFLELLYQIYPDCYCDDRKEK